MRYVDPSGEVPVVVPIMAVAFLLLTEPGYEIQKYVSPVAISIRPKFGAHQTGVGADVSVGVPKLSPVSYRRHWGASYYTKTYGGRSGWETRSGGEWTLFGNISISGTTFGGNLYPRSQTTNSITLGNPIMSISYENDTDGLSLLTNFTLPGVPVNDGGDAYRTAAVRVKWAGFFSAGMILHTGEWTSAPRRDGPDRFNRDFDGDGVNDTRAFEGGSIENPGESYGVLYLGFGGIRLGLDTESIRHLFQNRVAHDWIAGVVSYGGIQSNGSGYPWMMPLQRRPRPYLQYDWGSNITQY